MGVASKVIMMVVLVQLGLGQGIQPLLGYNYGARRWDRFKAVMRLSCFAGLGMGVILTLLCGVFSEELVSCFIDSEGIREYGTPFVRTLLLSGPVMGILFIYINALQAIGGGRVFIPALHQPARPHFHSMPIAVRPAIPAVRGGSGTTCGRHSFPPSGCLAVLAD